MAGTASPSTRRPTTLHQSIRSHEELVPFPAVQQRASERGGKKKEAERSAADEQFLSPAGGRGRLPALHRLAGGVWTLQAAGRPSARDRSISTPPREDEAPPPIAAQRHCGLDCTTALSCEQHEALGADVPLPLM